MIRSAPSLPPLLLLLIVTLLQCAPGAMGFMDFNQRCEPFTCRTSKLQAVQRADYVYKANGCGTAALPISTTVDFSECCNWHDVCYSTCGMPKAKCEKRLDKCMRAQCAAIADADAREQCESTAKIFSVGAQMLACPAYQESQRGACQCVPKDDVAEAQRERLEHFLASAGAPAKERTAAALDGLLAKYKGKEPMLHLRLAIKYPKAIQQDTSKRNFMEDIFKAGEGDHDLDNARMPGTAPGRGRDRFGVGVDKGDDDDDREEVSVDEHIEL